MHAQASTTLHNTAQHAVIVYIKSINGIVLYENTLYLCIVNKRQGPVSLMDRVIFNLFI